MRKEFEVTSCNVDWNMMNQCFEVLIEGKYNGLDSRIFIGNLNGTLNTQTMLEEANKTIRKAMKVCKQDSDETYCILNDYCETYGSYGS